MINSILSVCIGNICRSPMAAGLLRSRLPGVECNSAGLGALVGRGADPLAIKVLENAGINISDHRARQLDRGKVEASNLILVMDEEQRRELLALFPTVRGKVFLLMPDQRTGIFDPYKLGQKEFEECFALINSGVDHWVGRLKKLQ